MNKTINGQQFGQMLLGGITLLSKHVKEVNDLNVFPVPDGDTGTNMMRTLEGGISEIPSKGIESASSLFQSFAHGVLLGARGNSGVILSQIIAGLNEELSQHESIDAATLARACQCGVRRAYNAVNNPTEGTILTVFREATEYACENLTEESTVEDFFKLHIHQAQISLSKTKEILPVLAEADVVDSGGAGYLYMIRGMYQVLTGEMDTDYQFTEERKVQDISGFTRDSVLEFGYCTEFLLRLTTNKVDPDSFDVATVIEMLESLGGESIVAYKEGDIVKVHVHTFTPGAILSAAQAYGEFLTLKIENMSLGHSESTVQKKPKQQKKFSVVAVAAGEGMSALFRDMGADVIVAGGQSANPSTEEIISAFKECEGESILVLPNNKNVFLAANQAAELYTDAKVYMIPTANLMQGYGALSVITPGITDMEVLVSNVESAAKSVLDGEITQAVRNATVGGVSVKQGEYMALSSGKIVATAESAEEALLAMLDNKELDDYEIITLFAGKNVSEEQRAALVEHLEETYPDYEIIAYDGGQDIYDYLIAIE